MPQPHKSTTRDALEASSGVKRPSTAMTKKSPALWRADLAVEKAVIEGESSTSSRISSWLATPPPPQSISTTTRPPHREPCAGKEMSSMGKEEEEGG